MKVAIVAILSVLVIGGLVTGCTRRGQSVTVSNSQDNFHVQFLFEVDGVKLYRFKDRARRHYFAVAPDRLSVDNQIAQGKSSRPDRIDTVSTPAR